MRLLLFAGDLLKVFDSRIQKKKGGGKEDLEGQTDGVCYDLLKHRMTTCSRGESELMIHSAPSIVEFCI